ncbi:hypothetical protein SynBIOSE41_00831 [Synechococcus sp. BIOS-E4-1]|nr:hypothetical protein SynBIOSE41_00831 [Synechococcus sp. BIOS-E4-1]
MAGTLGEDTPDAILIALDPRQRMQPNAEELRFQYQQLQDELNQNPSVDPNSLGLSGDQVPAGEFGIPPTMIPMLRDRYLMGPQSPLASGR